MRRVESVYGCLVSIVGLLALSCQDGPPPGPTTPVGPIPPPAVPGPTPPPSVPTPTPPAPVAPNPEPPGDPTQERVPGQTRFTTVEETPPPGSSAGPGAAPAGRVASVEEADIYKIAGNHLYYFSTYRGFLVYDLSDPKRPLGPARLGIFGYPVEMFVEGNIVYAFVRDALYLTQTTGTVQFERHHVSQLHVIDVSDPRQPRLTRTIDISGQLFEGVSRKVGSVIHAVSVENGWGLRKQGQAWVHSFDIADPGNPRQTGRLPIVEPNSDARDERKFDEIVVAATPSVLLVAENYMDSARMEADGSFTRTRSRSVVSIFDISDPGGTIFRQARFETVGRIDDSFRMTYRPGPVAGKASFFGVLTRQNPAAPEPILTRMSVLETWELSAGAPPARLATLELGRYGKYGSGLPTAFDLERNLLYTIGSDSRDPLFVVDVADPAAPRIRSTLEESAGAIALFRPIASGQFLLGVAEHPAGPCTGEGTSYPDRLPAQIALTLLDVRDADRPRLAQRRCVSVAGADAVGTGLNRWRLSEAHKTLGMFAEGNLNILSVPIWFSRLHELDNRQQGWYYQWQTAVNLLSWDITRYDESRPPTQQSVIESHGTVPHPEGEVTRSIVFRHPVSGERSMLNLSDTHLSLASIENLQQPRLESSIEVAPAVFELQRFGSFIVERIDVGGRWLPDGAAEFRIKSAGGPLDDKAPVATFRVGQARAVHRHKDLLVVLRTTATPAQLVAPTEAVIYDLRDPTKPRLASRFKLPFESTLHYLLYCGFPDWGYWSGQANTTLGIERGLVFTYYSPSDKVHKVSVLDLSDPDAPSLLEAPVAAPTWSVRGLIADTSSPNGFYLTHRENADASATYSPLVRYRYYAQRWDLMGNRLVPGADLNLPGPLARAWLDSGGDRLFLAADNRFRGYGSANPSERHIDTRLHLLRQTGSDAQLVQTVELPDRQLDSLLFDGSRLFLGVRQLMPWESLHDGIDKPWELTSDRLVIFNLQSGRLAPVYDEPIRAHYTQLMGVHDTHLFIQIASEGVLAIDVSDLAHPSGARFLRTLGYANHVEFVQNEAYIASGGYGTVHYHLGAPPAL